VGIRWVGAVKCNIATDTHYTWAIVKVTDGDSPNNMSLSNGSSLYTPEQNVLAFGHGWVGATNSAGPIIHDFMGNTKTMRKLMDGDQLVFIATATQAAAANLNATVQFFCKT
jgi:hypothetical protein